MLAPTSEATLQKSPMLPLRFAWRELRGGLRGFGVFIICIALGVLAIAGVGSVAASLADGIGGAGQIILGGDVSFALIQRDATDAERTFLSEHGTVSVAALTRAMARTADGRSSLVEVKAVDDAYPLFGQVVTDPPMPLTNLFAQNDGAYGAAVDPSLLTRLDLKAGDRITVGAATIELRASLTSEPDKLTGGIGLGPRLLISNAALQASGLIQPGSLVRWLYRLRLPGDSSDRAVTALEKQAQSTFPDAGWEVRTRDKASPQLERNVERFTQFLTLVGLTTLLVGGVGVANAVSAHLARKRDAIATMKALGATGGSVFAIYCAQILLVASFAAALGAVLGAVLPYLLSRTFGALIPFPVEPSLHPGVLVLAILYGLLTALAFALWPLGRAHEIPVSMLFRDQIAAERRWPRRRYVIATVCIAAVLIALAIQTTYDHRIAAIFVASAIGVFVVLRLVAIATMWIARRMPRHRSTVLRLAIANIHRPGSLTATVILSLGLGLALLVTVIEIDANLNREFTAALPAKAPSFFFLDIPATEGNGFDAFIHEHAPGATLERVPMLRGRIVSMNGVKAEDLKPPPGSRWVLQGDRGITFSSVVPAGSRVVTGDWWNADYSGEPLVSLENKTAQDLNLKVGEPITVNVLGRNVTAKIANFRAVEWENLGINFVLVFSPGSFAGAPHSDIATLTFADGGSAAEETAIIKAMADAFPGITAVRVKDTLDTLDGIINKLVLALGGASSITLVAAAFVLGGALAASQRFRIYDAVLLKTFGATRMRLLTAYAVEYLFLGLISVVFGVIMGSIAAGLIVSLVMGFPFAWAAGQAGGAALAALGVTLALGLLGTFAALGRKPAEVLRNL